MMENLWKKEKVGDAPFYADLCKLVKGEYCVEVANQLNELTLKYNSTSSKSNEKSSAYLQHADQFYQQSDFECAMHNYTKALCYAEIGTANVSMALENRAKCFFQMEQYDQTMVDIHLALGAGCTKGLMSNLRELQDDCQKMSTSGECVQKTSDERLYQLDFQKHKKFPCLANIVDVQQNAEFGRHIVAKHDVDVGKVILMEESFASVVQSAERTCYTCLAESKNFIACPHCTDVVFCNDKCMNANQMHRLECHTIYHEMSYKMQFIIRTVLVATTAFPSIDDLMAFVEDHIQRQNLPESITDLQSKYSLYLQLEKFPLNDNAVMDVYNLFHSAMALPSVRKLFATLQKQRFLMHLLYHHLAVNVNNGYENDHTTSIGLVLCLFNHSCAPNLFNCAIDNKKFCITIRPVKKGKHFILLKCFLRRSWNRISFHEFSFAIFTGQQLFISYLPDSDDQTTKQRQDELKTRWHFECKCDKCAPHGKHAHTNKMRQDSCYKFVSRNFKNDASTFANTAQIRKKCIKFLQKFGDYPSANEVKYISDIYTTLL